MPVRSPPAATRFRHRGRVLPLPVARSPHSVASGEAMNSGHSSSDLSQSHLKGYAMSSIEQPAPSHSTKPERRRAPGPSSRLHETGPPQPRMVRLTVNLPEDLVDRVRNAVYWNPNLKLSWLIAQSLRTTLAEMESSRQGPFPQRKNPLRAGRPRMVGQTMQLFSRARLTRNGAARSAEGVSQATLVPPSVE
jgi:hypothetical protein